MKEIKDELAFQVAEFIGRCNLYQEKGKDGWYNEEGLFVNNTDALIIYVKELNNKAAIDKTTLKEKI